MFNFKLPLLFILLNSVFFLTASKYLFCNSVTKFKDHFDTKKKKFQKFHFIKKNKTFFRITRIPKFIQTFLLNVIFFILTIPRRIPQKYFFSSRHFEREQEKEKRYQCWCKLVYYMYQHAVLSKEAKRTKSDACSHLIPF